MYNVKSNTGRGNRKRLGSDWALQTSVMPWRSPGVFSRRRQGTESSEGCRQVGGSHSYSPKKVRMEDSRERQNTSSWQVRIPTELWAGTWENLTFFTGEKVPFLTRGQSWTGGPGMEAGFRRGQPQTGGTPGTTRTEEITDFNLSTDTESDLSPIWITKKFSERRRTR